jgi:hypothetical protein
MIRNRRNAGAAAERVKVSGSEILARENIAVIWLMHENKIF